MSPLFKIGVIRAILTSSGKITLAIDRLNMCNDGLYKSPKQFLIIVKQMSSKLRLLFMCSEKKNVFFSSLTLSGCCGCIMFNLII